MTGEGVPGLEGLDELDQAYFRAHGTLPPFIEPDTDPSSLANRIEALRRTDGRESFETTQRVGHEIVYLTERLAEMTQGQKYNK